MNLTEREECVFAYFLATEAKRFSVDGRFARREDFIKMFRDNLNATTQNLGDNLGDDCANIAAQLVDLLIAEHALTTSVDKYSGPLHQFDTPKYRVVIASLTGANATLQRHGDTGAIDWQVEISQFTQ